MSQHRKITLREVEDALDLLEHANYHDERERVKDLLRVLAHVDQTLVKHDKTPLARQLRQAFTKYVEGI